MSSKGAPLSRASLWLGLVTTALLVVTVAVIYLGPGPFGIVIPMPNGGELALQSLPLLLAPITGLSGLILGLWARRREGGEASGSALRINGVALAGAVLLLLLVFI